MMGSVNKPVYSVRVRELVEFVLRRGDLGGERDFVASDRALAGTRGHQKLQRSRPGGYEKEISLAQEVETEDFILRVQGRLDGVLTAAEQIVLEEIKTVQGFWDRTADPLHWAQAKCYGFIYAQDHGLKEIVVQLTYLELDSGAVTEFQERLGFDALKTFFETTVAVYLDWIRARHEWCRQRDESIRSLAFPFAGFRPGQRKLAVTVYRFLAKGGRLFLEAPTGIGKTVSVLFPSVKALGEGRVERIFYLTARTVGRVIAEKALADMRRCGLHLRALTLTAREKVCVRDGQPCELATCPLALGYYDRRHPAMRSILEAEEITRLVIERVSREHQVCPYELSLDVSVWVDAVICDYNYVFDPRVYLRRHFAEGGGDYVFLVDEAHNLVDRAREMFSADLSGEEIRETKRAVKTVPALAKALTKLAAQMVRTASAVQADTNDVVLDFDPAEELQFHAKTIPETKSPETFRSSWPERAGVRTSRELPADILPLMDLVLKEAEKWLVRNEPADFRALLLEFYFRLAAFRRTAELYDEHYVTIIESSPAIRWRLFCVDPSHLLRQALDRGKAAIFFSATLAPLDYYRALLGGTPEDPVLQLPSPFPPEHLAVLVQDRIPTHFKAREASLAEVAQAIGTLVRERSGNYLVYLPSYKYLNAVRERFEAGYPEIPVIGQSPGMSEPERDAFLAAFQVEQGKTLVGRTLIGFAVMGGVFGEGIDLVGERLIGAIIVGVGLPQISVERDLVRDYFQNESVRGSGGRGFDYAYTFPGMNRVLQAVGRVIRTETDRGVVLLIDARFGEGRYRRLFPAWWQVTRVRSAEKIGEAARAFWEA
jgi:DNA excision repair protein ERCC-2